MEKFNYFAQDYLTKMKKKKEAIDKFTRDNPKPSDEYCNNHPNIAISIYEAEYDAEKEEVFWEKMEVGCERCREEENIQFGIQQALEKASIPLRYAELEPSDEYRKYIDKKMGILFTGGVGTGKTYELVRLMKSLIASGEKVRFRTFGELCREIRDAVGDNNYTALYNKYVSNQIFIIDDLGVENSTPFIKEFIYNLVNDLYNDNKILIVTTNLTSEELLANYSQRVVSRLSEMCEVVKLTGKDQRNKK